MRKFNYLLVTSLFFALAVSFLPESSQAKPMDVPPIQTGSELLAAVNSLRASSGLPAYNANSILMQIAQAHADYMAATGGANGHTGPGGTRPIDRAIAAGYPAQFFSENWQAGSGMSPSGAVVAWQGDAPHLHTMLSPDMVDAGSGVSKAGGLTYYVLDAGATGSSAGSGSTVTTTGTSVPPGTAQPSQFMVPVTLNTPDSGGLVYHEVAYGQSLWSIAIAYGVKIEEIQSLNGLPGNDIYPGQKLLIMRGAPPAPAEATAPEIEVANPATQEITSTQESEVDVDIPSQPAEMEPQQPPARLSFNLTAMAIIGVALVFAIIATWAGTRKQGGRMEKAPVEPAAPGELESDPHIDTPVDTDTTESTDSDPK